MLEKYEIPIVASVLKLYLLELPDSLVSAHVYEIIKTIYTTTAPGASESARISVIQSTLGQLRLANIASLDAITTHFSRLIELTSADETYVAALANVLAPCILRLKQGTSLSMAEKFNVRLVRDLLAHKDAIFGELKRQSSLTHTSSGAQRPRAISTDESRRREHMEERQRAIIAAADQRGRASSPFRSSFATDGSAPQHSPSTAHRRDRSSGALTRFPVAAASTTPTDRTRARSSLEVPTSPPKSMHTGPQSPPAENGVSAPIAEEYAHYLDAMSVPKTRERSDTNGSVIITPGASNEMPDYMAQQHYASTTTSPEETENGSTATADTPQQTPVNSVKAEVEKRNSLNRTGASRPYTRKATPGMGLQRQSLIAKRDSVSSVATSGSGHGGYGVRASLTGGESEVVSSPVDVRTSSELAAAAAEALEAKRGVELVDRPMDD